MKKHKLIYLCAIAGAALVLQSCARNSDDVWEDSKSAGRHMGRGIKALCGTYGDSRQIRSRQDFESMGDGSEIQYGDYQDENYQGANYDGAEYSNDNQYSASDYIPLQDTQDIAMADIGAPPSRETPGERGSSIPGIQAFRDPSTIPQLAGVFRNIYFEYDSSLLKGSENLQTIHNIADYLRKNPNIYVFIEGHTDERGPQAYNLALGSRRSNTIRNLLTSEGVDPDRLFTISHGKERPVILENHEEGWSKNRRVEFKVYAR